MGSIQNGKEIKKDQYAEPQNEQGSKLWNLDNTKTEVVI